MDAMYITNSDFWREGLGYILIKILMDFFKSKNKTYKVMRVRGIRNIHTLFSLANDFKLYGIIKT